MTLSRAKTCVPGFSNPGGTWIDYPMRIGAGQGTTDAVALPGSDVAQLSQSHAKVSSGAASNAYASRYDTITVTATPTHHHSAFGAWAECYITGGTIDLSGGDNFAGMWGHLEISGGTSVTGPSTSCYYGGVVATVMSSGTFVNNCILAGVISDSIITSSGFTNNYVTAGIACIVSQSHATKKSWDCAMYVEGCDNIFIFETGTAYKDGVKVVSSTVSGTCSALAKVKCRNTATTYYLPLYGAGEVTNE